MKTSVFETMSRMNRYSIEESVQRLNALNQAIWENGFTTQTLTELKKVTQEINNGTTLFERIPQAQQPGLSKGSSILTAAGIICRGCPRTESEVREIYHTDELIGGGMRYTCMIGSMDGGAVIHVLQPLIVVVDKVFINR